MNDAQSPISRSATTTVPEFSTVPNAPASSDLALVEQLATELTELGFTMKGIAALVGEAATAALERDEIMPALVATATASKDEQGLAAAVRLWLLGQEVAESTVAAALPAVGVAGLSGLGLIEPGTASGSVRAAVDLRPYGWVNGPEEEYEIWVASDLGAHQRPGPLRKDHVLGIGQASLTLARNVVRQPVDSALDLGTGCGIQTFHLLTHAAHVTATDISERALGFTRFNLVLNSPVLGLNPNQLDQRVSLRRGSLLDPVAGEEFTLVVSNPPFVITPRHRGELAAEQYTYRDGGLAGDDLVSGLIQALPEVLRPGGTAQLLANWEISGEAAWDARPRQWVSSGTEAWFLQRDQASGEEYAQTWLRDSSQVSAIEDYVAAYADYQADFASRNVTAIGFGYVWLRKPQFPAQEPWLRFEEITYPLESPLGPYWADAVQRRDWLAQAGLSTSHLVVADDVTEERHQRPGAEHPGIILLRQGAGFRRTNLLSQELAGFVSACDGDLSVQQIIGALAMLLERDDADFTSQLLADVGNLVLDGFLLPSFVAGR